MKRKSWTPGEANRTLPLVKRIVSDILACGQQWRSLAQDEHAPEDHPRLGELERQLGDLMRELEQIGCYYKDWGFDKGLIDFPARIGDQQVFLCWRSDEPAVSWYHPMEGGYAARRPIPLELLE